MKDLQTLKAACDVAVSNPCFVPKDGVTHCNQAAQFIANQMGCHELDGLMADQQYGVMAANKSGLWLQVPGTAAAGWAESGGLAIAGMTSEMLKEEHGHVAVCYPGAMEFSPSLNKTVPLVANVGKTNLEEKESCAFPVADGEAIYFTWAG